MPKRLVKYVKEGFFNLVQSIKEAWCQYFLQNREILLESVGLIGDDRQHEAGSWKVSKHFALLQIWDQLASQGVAQMLKCEIDNSLSIFLDHFFKASAQFRQHDLGGLRAAAVFQEEVDFRRIWSIVFPCELYFLIKDGKKNSLSHSDHPLRTHLVHLDQSS